MMSGLQPAVFKDLGRCLTLPAAAPIRLSDVIGVIAQGNGRLVMEVIDAHGDGLSVQIRWHNTTKAIP